MKKTAFIAACAIFAMLIACTARADSYLVLRKTPLLQAPSASAKVLAKADRGWLAHGKTEKGQSGTEEWLEVYEMQKASGSGFVYAHMAVKGAQGSVYASAGDVMPVPDQKEQVLPGEDCYTPSCDCDGLVFRAKDGKDLPFGENWIQEAGKFEFSKMFAGQDIPGMAGSESGSLRIDSIKKDAGNPWQYSVSATCSGFGTRTYGMTGTLTLKKAGLITGEFGTPCVAETGAMAVSALTEVHHGFTGADLLLKSEDGATELKGILISFFMLRFNPQAMSFDKNVLLNNIPEQLKDPNYRNFQMTAVLKQGSREETAFFGAGRLGCPDQGRRQNN